MKKVHIAHVILLGAVIYSTTYVKRGKIQYVGSKTGVSEGDKIHIQPTQKHMQWICRYSQENISQRVFLKWGFLFLSMVIKTTNTFSVNKNMANCPKNRHILTVVILTATIRIF